MVTCPSCSQAVADDAAFCNRCGARLKADAPGAATAPMPVLSSNIPAAGSGGTLSQATVAAASSVAAPMLAPPASAPVVPQVTVNVNTPAPQSTVVVMDSSSGSPGFLVRMIWFVFVGWWLSFIWIGVAWGLNLTVIGLPLGLMMINRVPTVLTLKGNRKQLSVTQQGGVTLIQRVDVAQHPMWVRAVYFVLVGWWASLLFAYVGWGLSVLVITLPIGLLMFNYLPQVTTLRRT